MSALADVLNQRLVYVSKEWKFEWPLGLRLHEDEALLAPVDVLEAKSADVTRAQAETCGQKQYRVVALAQSGGTIHARDEPLYRRFVYHLRRPAHLIDPWNLHRINQVGRQCPLQPQITQEPAQS